MSEPETRTRPPRIYPKVDAEDVPVVEEYVSLPDAADEMGLSRKRVHQMAGEGKFKTLRKLSKEGRPTFMIKRTELAEIIAGGVEPEEADAPNVLIPTFKSPV